MPIPKDLALGLSSGVEPLVENGYLQFFFNLTLLEEGEQYFRVPNKITQLPSYFDNGSEL